MTSIPASPSQRLLRGPVLVLGLAALSVVIAAIARILYPLPSTPTAPAAPVAFSSQGMVDRLQSRLQQNPDDANAYAQLGLALLQQVRETGDLSLYARAGQAFDEALARDPQQIDALIGQGVLALALHDFQGALIWADQAWAINPFRAETLGVRVDAELELGRYDDAVQTLQKMVDLRPDLNSYSRVSYVRELYGDGEGALEAMQAAVLAARPGSEQWLWTLTHVGHLYFNQGNLAQASAIYTQVLEAKADYPYAVAGMARVQAAQGRTANAVALYQQVIERLPLPEFVIGLGELYASTGRPVDAREQYDLVEVMQQLNAAAGMNVDLELALFYANHGTDLAAAVAQARTAYAQRPTLYAADILAWALYRHGDYAEAWRYSQEALRLGTRDALLHFHAGMIARKRGDIAAAQTHLQTALQINPYFSPLYAPIVQQELQGMALASGQ